jgi:hypothetical protein
LHASNRCIIGAVSLAAVPAVIVGVVLYLNGARHETPAAARPGHPAAAEPDGRRAARSAASFRQIVRKSLPHKTLFCVLAPGATSLPPWRLRGLAHHLRQYPDVTLATAAQATVAERLLTTLHSAALRWSNPREVAAAGYDTHTAARAAGDKTPHYLHAENRRFANDGRYLDPKRPEALIYANVPGHPLLLIGVMFSMPRGIHGPSPAGPIARWHFHHVCARGDHRGLKPLGDGLCPSGETLREGSEMLHVWFTHDLRSAYAIRAPEPELCTARLLPAAYCASGRKLVGM